MKKQTTSLFLLLLCIFSFHFPANASSSSYFYNKTTSITLTDGYSYDEAKLEDLFVNKEGRTIIVNDFYFEGGDAEYFAFSSAYSASNINNYTKFNLGTSSTFYIFFDLDMKEGVYTTDLVVDTEVGIFRSPLCHRAESPHHDPQ